MVEQKDQEHRHKAHAEHAHASGADQKVKTTHQKDAKDTAHHPQAKKENLLTRPIIGLLLLAAFFLAFNQLQIAGISAMAIGGDGSGSVARTGSTGALDLAAVKVDELKSTGHTVAAVFPVEEIVTSEDAVAVMFPTGTPEYGADLGVSFDEPVESLAILARMYPGLKQEVQTSNPAAWTRFMTLASKPVGISCEYCCGLKAVGIDSKGNSACGCQHNPALLSIALYLTAYSDYSDAEILREVMRWKTLFFPKNMIELGLSVAGGDTSKLAELPGMVGGC